MGINYNKKLKTYTLSPPFVPYETDEDFKFHWSKNNNITPKRIEKHLKKHNLWNSLSDKEKNFIKNCKEGVS